MDYKEAIDAIADGSFFDDYDLASQRLGHLRDLAEKYERLHSKSENLLIGIGMGWDLEGLIDCLKSELEPTQ